MRLVPKARDFAHLLLIFNLLFSVCNCFCLFGFFWGWGGGKGGILPLLFLLFLVVVFCGGCFFFWGFLAPFVVHVILVMYCIALLPYWLGNILARFERDGCHAFFRRVCILTCICVISWFEAL